MAHRFIIFRKQISIINKKTDSRIWLRCHLSEQFFFKIFYNLSFNDFKKQKRDAQIIVAPRGMLKGSLQLKSEKKRIYIFIAKLLGLYNGVLWHASSEIERKGI